MKKKTTCSLVGYGPKLFNVDRTTNLPLTVCYFLFLTADRTAYSFLCYPIVAERWSYSQVAKVMCTAGNSPSRTFAHLAHGIIHRIGDCMIYNCLSKVVCLVVGVAGGICKWKGIPTVQLHNMCSFCLDVRMIAEPCKRLAKCDGRSFDSQYNMASGWMK